MIIDSVNGFLCKKNDKESLISKINEALNLDLIKRSSIIEAARERAMKLSPDVTVKQLVDFYKQVIDGK